MFLTPVCFWFPRLRGLPSSHSESAKLSIFLNSKTVYEKEIDLQNFFLKISEETSNKSPLIQA